MQRYEYFVMDGRAEIDIERASLYEAVGNNLPSEKKLHKDWGDMGAYLCRAPVIAALPDGGSQCGEIEIIRIIK